MKRAALVYKGDIHPDASRVGLGVTVTGNAKSLSRAGMPADAFAVRNAADIRARAANYSHVVISAPWIATSDLARLAFDFPQVSFAVVVHSNWAFLAADRRAVTLLREAADLQHTTKNVRIGSNNENFARSATEVFGVRCAWLPNLYDSSEPEARPAHWTRGTPVRVGLFGAARILKNGTTAAAAAAHLATDVRAPVELHVSERDGGGVIAEIAAACAPRVSLHATGWQAWPAFRRTVGSMHVLLQPSFTESFNVVTADGIHQGVPSVVSSAIDWVPHHWRANPDDARDVARVAQRLLHDRHAAEEGRECLSRYLVTGLQEWRKYYYGVCV